MAAPTIVQKICGIPSTTLSFGVAPSNGNIVTVTETGVPGGGVGVRDSNVVSLTYRSLMAGGAQGTQIQDYTVSGSPTATYTFTGTPLPSEACMYELSGVAIPGAYTPQFGGSAVFTQTLTLTGVVSGDIQICVANTYGTLSSLTMANGGAVNDAFFGVSGIGFAHATATSTASSTCVSTSTAFGNATTYADYPAPQASSGFIGSSGLYLFR